VKFYNGFIPATSASAFTNSQPLKKLDYMSAFILVEFTGSDVAGSLKLQTSIDGLSTSTWVDIANSTQAITASAPHAWSISEAPYPYIRVSWTYTSGTGNISAKAAIPEPTISRGA
jgi:hypothetical protein